LWKAATVKIGMKMAMLIVTGSLASGCGAEDRFSDAANTISGGTAVENSDSDTSSATRAVVGRGIVISSERGRITADLVDSPATRALLARLPLTIEMRDHLRQEKTGPLPAPLPNGSRQTDFSAGTIGLWGTNDFVIYYRNGRVPSPGIVVLGRVNGDASMFDTPGSVTVQIKKGN
jgi:hypothetical protein